MKRSAAVATWLSLAAAVSTSFAAERVPAEYPSDDPTIGYPAQSLRRGPGLDVDVWINKDEGGVYRPGESMRVYFRTNRDAHVLVFNVDTEGYIHLVYPYGQEDGSYVEGGRTNRVPSRSDPYDLVADGPPGIEYVVAVASPEPFENLPWYLSPGADGRRPNDDDDDDDTESGHLVGDPYVGIDRILRRIVPPGLEDRVATNETYFYIGRRVEYPRYVCADCHYHPFYFDPYLSACSVFEIRIDATWAHYAPIRFGTVRPRYIYRVRAQAPTRYRQWKQQWSSLDGRTTLRSRFLPERDIRYRRERPQQVRPQRPEFRDLRRYREGRIWRGHDEVLRLRERRDQAGPPQTRDRGREGDRQRPERGWWRRGERPERGQGQGRSDDRGSRQREERRGPPEDRGWRQRGERPNPSEDRGWRGREERGDRPERRERPQPPDARGDRSERRERPAPREERGNREERGRDRGDHDRGRGNDRDRGDRDGGNDRDRDDHDRGRGHDRGR